MEDHATLLCSLLLGFGLDAYVVLGSVRDRGEAPQPHAWVMTLSSEGKTRVVHFWESLSGQRFRMRPHSAPSTHGAKKGPSVLHPKATRYHSIGCVFSPSRLLANKHEDDRVSACVFDLDDDRYWRAMDENRLHALLHPTTSLCPSHMALRPGTVDPLAAAEFLESELRLRVSKLRVNLGTSFIRHPGCSGLVYRLAAPLRTSSLFPWLTLPFPATSSSLQAWTRGGTRRCRACSTPPWCPTSSSGSLAQPASSTTIFRPPSSATCLRATPSRATPRASTTWTPRARPRRCSTVPTTRRTTWCMCGATMRALPCVSA